MSDMLDYKLEEVLFGEYHLSFKMPASNPKSVHLVEDAMLEFEGEKFFITEVVKGRTNNETYVSVLAEAGHMRLADIKRSGSFILTGVSVETGLDAILSGTSWVRAQASNQAGAYSIEAQDTSVLDLLYQWAKITSCEVSFEQVSRRVTMIPQVGANRGLSFRYGRNLTSIKRTARPPRATRVFAYGRNDLDISSHTTGGVPYIEDYSYYTDQGLSLEDAETYYRKDEILSDDVFIDSDSLYEAAQRRLAIVSQPSVTYQVSVSDLSALTGLAEGDYRVGDTVYVYDDELGINIQARVTRRIRYPYEAERNQVELAYGDILLPNTGTSTSRSNTTKEWELFESQNRVGIRKVRNYNTVMHRIRLRTIEGAEWTHHYQLEGVGVGTGNVTITPVDDETGNPIWPEKVIPITPGAAISWSFSFGEKEVPSGDYVFTIRATSDTAGVGIDIDERGTAYWILARGSTRENVVLTNSVRFDYTAALQTWEVPDDVFEVLIEAHGSRGAAGAWDGVSNSGSGKGGMVKANFAVLGGQVYDILVGGHGSFATGGYPDGGNGGAVFGAEVTGGGGSSQVRPQGGSITSAMVIAAGGGGDGDGNSAPSYGGYGGFYQGGEPGYGSSRKSTEVGTIPLRGATQDAPGIGGWDATYGPEAGWSKSGEDGDTDGQGQGGDSPTVGNFFAFDGGGGGGGWHGGGAGGSPPSSGLYGGGGGGGAGWMAGGWDLETEDDENDGQGYIIISWETPEGE